MPFATISDCVVTRTSDDDLCTARRFGGSQDRHHLRTFVDRVRSACSFSGSHGTALLLNIYECIYGAAVAVVLAGPVLAVAGIVPFPDFGCSPRWRRSAFWRWARLIACASSGATPAFLVRSLRFSWKPQVPVLHEHGARDRALVELHQKYGPVVKLHMAWGCTPFVSISSAPKDLGRNDMDSNRVADRTLLSRSLMGLKRGERHTAHRQKMSPHFTPKAVLQAASRLDQVSRSIFGPGDAGRPGTAA